MPLVNRRFTLKSIARRASAAPPALLAAVCLATASLAAGCYESDFPLDPAPLVQTDSRLLGAWRCATPDPGDAVIDLTVNASRDRTYAITLQEAGQNRDRYTAYTSSLKSTTLLNVRHAGATATSRWWFVRDTLLEPNVLLIQVVHERLLERAPASPAEMRNTLEREHDNPELYDNPMVCIRGRAASR